MLFSKTVSNRFFQHDAKLLSAVVLTTLLVACGRTEKTATLPTPAPAVQLSAEQLIAKGAQDRLIAPVQPLTAVAELGRKIFSINRYQRPANYPAPLAIILTPPYAPNKDPHYYDLGMCGPLRQDAGEMKNYCGFFKTPGLRNTATRHVYFHNGVFKSLDEVMHFYVERETKPEKWYPRKNGTVEKYNDIPADQHVNVDVKDAPFDRKWGDQPALTEDEIQDIIAFLKTLTDGYRFETVGAAQK